MMSLKKKQSWRRRGWEGCRGGKGMSELRPKGSKTISNKAASKMHPRPPPTTETETPSVCLTHLLGYKHFTLVRGLRNPDTTCFSSSSLVMSPTPQQWLKYSTGPIFKILFALALALCWAQGEGVCTQYGVPASDWGPWACHDLCRNSITCSGPKWLSTQRPEDGWLWERHLVHSRTDSTKRLLSHRGQAWREKACGSIQIQLHHCPYNSW